ncbi:MAG: hypothetical protein O6924_07700 [Alphaproteobacteria bacterium]|nr:hypothetical protein [Alphaproteobacteria bacterium]
MKKMIYIFAIFASVMLTQASVGEIQMPPFLPDYFGPAFKVGGKQLSLEKKSAKNDEQRFDYATKDQSVRMIVMNLGCDRVRCENVFKNMLGLLNDKMKNTGGEFHKISPREVFAKTHHRGGEAFFFTYWLPTSVQYWVYVVPSGNIQGISDKFAVITAFVDRQRYHKARSAGNVSMGLWGPEAHNYARRLLRQGKKPKALAVLKNVVTTSPDNYDAHIDFFTNTKDTAAARESARIVFENAEDREHIDKAAKILGKPAATFEAIPLLQKNETGLQLILIPLPPINPWLLEEAAKIYSKITGVPVNIRRLKETWKFSAPGRIARQRQIQRTLMRLKGRDIDFAGWGKARYVRELLKAVETKDPLSRYRAREIASKIDKEPGQYLAGPYLSVFSQTLKRYRSDDARTMYVGITEANIYSGDNNYLFSYGGSKPGASILSYSVMRAAAFSRTSPSKRRLNERIAKELVPASLKQLKIRRSTDPRDPYSYSSGLRRLDQKTFILSNHVKEALKEAAR